MLAHTTIEQQLDLHTPILRASCCGLVIRYRRSLTITHRRDETTKRNFMLHCQVLNHCVGTLPTELEILCLTAGRVRIAADLDHIPLGIEGLFSQRVELLLGLR